MVSRMPFMEKEKPQDVLLVSMSLLGGKKLSFVS